MIDDRNGDDRQKLIDEGAMLTLRRAVQELLTVADQMLEPNRRPPVAHGGAYLDRWRFERLRRAYQEDMKGFSSLEKELEDAPQTWVPALLKTLVRTAVKKHVFKEGGLEVFIQGALER